MAAKVKSQVQPSHKLTSLPFVADIRGKDGKTETCYWKVPKQTKDYVQACQVGSSYAIAFLQFIENDPFWVGSGSMLRSITADIIKHTTEKNKGYAIGFWSGLEEALYFTAQNAVLNAPKHETSATIMKRARRPRLRLVKD